MQTYRENISNNICRNIFACRHDPDMETDNRQDSRHDTEHIKDIQNKDNFTMAGVSDKENIFNSQTLYIPRERFLDPPPPGPTSYQFCTWI